MPQVAALPYRIGDGGQVEILLVTTRRTKRYIFPKGWRMKGRSDAEAAAQEAQEEAGVLGTISKHPIGQYFYWKELSRMSIQIRVSVYTLAVVEQLWQWPEQDERTRIWVHPDRAAVMISDRALIPFIKEVQRFSQVLVNSNEIA
ncbi:8-oxo-dGTP pyrophosphatase MutT (NUDIX family) [Phyllobacterium sp. 1468]|uniref:NUDIX hydrolase n=1 Tax=Phyllobacterium sp. 1468 TaxID=2817759 RepID=UPI001AEAE1B4|nr:NUDIX hydrolase [Phyllobacterium sp. 1468]MDR6635428.1 8-oxo-dGTP pyrophosphatase MutT (NUDIX family) [Phyllobacterium sp. 1468]